MDEKQIIEEIKTSVNTLYNVMGINVNEDLKAVRDDFSIIIEADPNEAELEKACVAWLDDSKNLDTFSKLVEDKFKAQEKTKETIDR